MADRKKWQRFEAEKRKLAEKGLTYAEYEREVKKLLRKYGQAGGVSAERRWPVLSVNDKFSRQKSARNGKEVGI